MSTAKEFEVSTARVTDELVTRLRSALERHAITLPSLRADHPVAGLPLIELGRCNQQTVEKLIAALTGQAGPDCGLGAEEGRLGQASA